MTTLTKLEYKPPAQMAEPSATAAAISPAALIGTYTNVDHATGNIVKIVIAAAGTGITVHGLGACSPTPCDWGAVSAPAYSASVNSTTAVAFTAQYRFSFSQVTLVGHSPAELFVESFTHFTNSGCDDYYSTNVMSR